MEWGQAVVSASPRIQNLLQHGVNCHRDGDRIAAADKYRQVLRIDPKNADALNLSGVIAFQNGQLQEAERWIRSALEQNPNNCQYLNNLAAVQLQAEAWAAATITAAASLAQDARNSEAKKHLSTALHRTGRCREAVQFAEEAVEESPDDIDLRIHLGALQLAAGQPRCALQTLTLAQRTVAQRSIGQRTIAKKTNVQQSVQYSTGQSYPVLDLHLGAAQRQLGFFNEALDSLNRTLAIRPDLPAALINRGNTLVSLNRPEEAQADFQRALELNPRSAAALNGLGQALQISGHWSQSLEALRLAWLCDDQQRSFDSNYLYCTSLAPQMSREQASQIHKAWGRAVEGSVSFIKHPDCDDPERPLVVGYVSPDFRNHATMRFFLPLLKNHDQSRVRILCYSETVCEDAVTEQVREHCCEWRTTAGRTDNEVAEQIVQDRVDILIDLAGHTAGNRLRIFAKQPAPVQATFLGYPCTTGLSRIQWFLTDRFRETQQTAAYFSEQLFVLPHSACCFEMTGCIPQIVEPPSLQTGTITFGSTHRLEKLSGQCLQLWAHVLERVPRSRLRVCRDVLGSSEGFRQQFLKRLAAAGIPQNRVDLEWEFGGSHLEVYSQIDILLDVFPWASGTTAWECLWLGVPIPAIQQSEKSSASTASLLMNCGFPQLVAPDEGSYLELIEKLANDSDELLKLRFALQPAMQATVCDAASYARDFEQALRTLWRRRCSDASNKNPSEEFDGGHRTSQGVL